MAYAAVQNHVPAIAWTLLGVNFFWVMAYDTEYAMVDRDDDVRIDIRTSAITFGRFDIAAVALSYAVFIAGMAFIGHAYGRGIPFYAGLAVALVFAIRHVSMIRTRDPAACFRAFLDNHWLGMAVFVAIAVDYAVEGRWPSAL